MGQKKQRDNSPTLTSHKYFSPVACGAFPPEIFQPGRTPGNSNRHTSWAFIASAPPPPPRRRHGGGGRPLLSGKNQGSEAKNKTVYVKLAFHFWPL